MLPPLLATKLSIPQIRRDFVPRPHLIERLNSGLAGPLTLISAPAGYGKSTLLSEWRTQAARDVPVAWLSLDAEDNDLPRFLFYLAAAFDTVQAGMAGNTTALLQSPQPAPIETFLASLLNDLSSFRNELILAFDDYFLIDSQAVHEVVAFLLAHRPARLHLVILTREDPPLPLPKLRARGELAEIREVDLRFSMDEAAAFLSQTMGLTLPDQAVANLVGRTEGWIAGLQMAALALQSQLAANNLGSAEEFIAAFRGDDRYVMDYLMEEVFHRQPEEIQDFLLDTAILDRLCAPLCDVIFEDKRANKDVSASGALSHSSPKNSQTILEHLERTNMFLLPLDNRREWYRYHALFADLLLYRLKRERPERITELHRRASAWFVQAGYPDEAMNHALAVPDYSLAADVAEQFVIQMTGSSRIRTYLNWLQQLPEEEIRKRAYLCAGCGWAYVLSSQLEPTEKYLEAGEKALENYQPIYSQPDCRWISREELRGHLAAIRSYADLRRGDPQAAIMHAQQALDILPGDAHAISCAVALNLGLLYFESRDLESARQALTEAFELAKEPKGNIYVATSALRTLGVIAAMQGKLNQAADIYQRSIQYGTDKAGTHLSIPSVGATHIWLAELHYQRNEIEIAQEHLEKALQSSGQLGAPDAFMRAYLYQALIAQCRGDLILAEESLSRAEELMQLHPAQDITQTERITIGGQFYLSQGDLPAAEKLLQAPGVQASDLDEKPAPSSQGFQLLAARLPRYLLLARLLLAKGKQDQAALLLDGIYACAEAYPEFPVFLEVLVWKAVMAYRIRGNSADALLYLGRALELAAPEGYVQPFLKAGKPLVKLLRQAVIQDIQPGYAQKLLMALNDREHQSIDRTSAAIRLPEMAEPLTSREHQILRLLAAGLSSTEIASELFLAVSTTRTYIKILYQKLDAHSRDEAIEKGHQFGII